MKVLMWHPADTLCREGGEELIAQWRLDPTRLLWIDLSPEDGDAQRTLLQQFGADSTVCNQALAARFPPKVETLPTTTFILLRALNAAAESMEFGTIQITFLVGDRVLVTRHDEHSPSIAKTWATMTGGQEPLASSPAAIAVQVADTVASRFLPIMHRLESRLEDIEDEMFESPTDSLLEELLLYKRKLKSVRRIASYHSTIFEMLKREHAHRFEHVQRDIGEVRDQFDRIVSLASLYNELANDLMNGYLSLASHRLNNIMKVLTIITCIFVPLSFIAGIYGMNFEVMPELSSRNGYFIVLGVMAAIALGLLWGFRSRRWL